MELDLCPAVTLQTGTFCALVAPPGLVTSPLNSNPGLRRFMFLYICGNYSRVLSDVRVTASTFEVRRAFTAFQLLTALAEASHTIVLVEHDPSLYDGDDGGKVIAQVGSAFRNAARDAMVILYAPSADMHFHALAKRADRVFYLAPETPGFAYGSTRGRARHGPGGRNGREGAKRQMTLERFNG
jgi:DNA polymerase I